MTKDDSNLIISHINEKFEGFEKKLDSLISKFDIDHDKLTEHTIVINENKKDIDKLGLKLRDFQKDVNGNFKKLVAACVLLGSGFGIKEILGALL
jgi:hypothetical protein